MSATIFTIKRSEIEGRLDPIYYIRKNELVGLKHIRLEKIGKHFFVKDGDHDKLPADAVTNELEGFRYLRAQDLKDNKIISEKPIYVTKKYFESVRRCHIYPNDLLFSIMASVGATAVVPKDSPVCTANRAVGILRTKPESLFMPQYVQVVLNTELGIKLLELQKRGGIQQRVNLEDISNLELPVFDFDRQHKIIDFYNSSLFQKEQKQQQAKQLLDSIDSYLLKELRIKLPEKDNSLSKRIFTTKFSEVSGGRWDPFWQISQKNKMKSNNFSEFKVKELANIQKGESITSDEIKEGNFPVIAGGKTSPYSHNVSNFNGNVITISASGAYSGYVWYHKKPIFASDCSVLTSLDESNCTTLFLYEVLHLKQEELYNLQQGAGQPHVYPDDIAEIKIPLPPLPKQKEIASHIREIREQAKQLQVEAEQTMQEAKKQIEKMILGE